MTSTVKSVLACLDGELTPIRLVAERLVDAEAVLDPNNGVALFSRRPKLGTEAYACVIFARISQEVISRYEDLQTFTRKCDFGIPPIYKNVLLRMNGASIFGLILFGLPPSMCKDPPLLDRCARQPLDLGTANLYWRREYEAASTQFQFGSSQYSRDENIAYFLNEDGCVAGVLKRGRKVWEWPSIESFLSAELARVETQFADFEFSTGAVLGAEANKNPKGGRKPPTL